MSSTLGTPPLKPSTAHGARPGGAHPAATARAAGGSFRDALLSAAQPLDDAPLVAKASAAANAADADALERKAPGSAADEAGQASATPTAADKPGTPPLDLPALLAQLGGRPGGEPAPCTVPAEATPASGTAPGVTDRSRRAVAAPPALAASREAPPSAAPGADAASAATALDAANGASFQNAAASAKAADKTDATATANAASAAEATSGAAPDAGPAHRFMVADAAGPGTAIGDSADARPLAGEAGLPAPAATAAPRRSAGAAAVVSGASEASALSDASAPTPALATPSAQEQSGAPARPAPGRSGVDRAQAAVAADRGAPATRTAGAPAGPHLDGGAGGKGLGEASGTLPGQAAGTSPAAPVAGADAAVTPTAAAGAFTLPVDNAAQPAAPPAPQASAGAPFHAYLAAGVNSPGFAPALGTQLRMLVREGIGEANLELNPGEMGPVSVRIELEGRQAHVEFGADLAATRTALQESLPTLAAALREGGFTLSGGGVSERQSGGGGGQPEQRPGSGGGSGGLAAGQGDGAAATPAARQGAQARGVVDLFA